MNNKKRKYWAFILYLESAPSDWLQILKTNGIKFAVSPYHDKDIEPNGKTKKAHFHIILAYENTTTYNNVKQLVVDTLGQPIPIDLNSPVGYYRYFTHKDNPDKHQYSEKDIQCFNGFDASDYIGLTKTEVEQLIYQIMSLIKDNDIIEYSDLLDLLGEQEDLSMFKVASSHTILFNTYLSSKRHRKK